MYCLKFEQVYALFFRADGNQHNLRSAAYEALMEMVKNSPKVTLYYFYVAANLMSSFSLEY
jgi:hypothetical protein